MVGGGWRGGNGRSAGATAGHCHGLDVDAHSPGDGMRKRGFSRGERVVRAEPPRIKLVPSRETPESPVALFAIRDHRGKTASREPGHGPSPSLWPGLAGLRTCDRSGPLTPPCVRQCVTAG